MRALTLPARLPIRRRPVAGPHLLLLVVLSCLLALPAFPQAGRAAQAEELSPEVLELRNRSLALLENEQPTEAEKLLEELAAKVPGDPLPWANLAIARLRQQKTEGAEEAIAKALEKAPERPDLLAIRAEILQWTGREGEALELLQEAVRQAPKDLEIVYGLYRLASTLNTEEAGSWERQALEQLARLRPENVVVLSALGRRAIAAGDRSAASGAYLRLGELAWQGPAAVGQVLERVRQALEAGDLEAARVPAQRLENVLKITPMFQQSLRELTLGIQGTPVLRFEGEPPPADFGAPAEVTFRARRRSPVATPIESAAAMAVGDADGDGIPDLARSVGTEGGTALEVRLSGSDEPRRLTAPAGLRGVSWVDLDNDGQRDLLAWGSGGIAYWRGGEGGELTAATAEMGLDGARGTAGASLDFDIEGDLDLALFDRADDQGKGRQLYRNHLQGALEEVGEKALPQVVAEDPRQLLASDLDRDGDQDLLLLHAGGLTVLDNLRQGRFAERTREYGLAGAGAARAAVAADFDNDGLLDLVTLPEAGASGLAFFHNREGRFRPAAPEAALPEGFSPRVLATLDADNDGRLDLALAGVGPGGQDGAVVLAQRGERGKGLDGLRFELLPVEGPEGGDEERGLGEVSALAVADADRDGDLDLWAAGPGGLHLLTNAGGNANPWLQVRLRGLATGNSKNNLLGVGSWVEVFAGSAYQFREADGGLIHFGLGSVREPDVLRVTWTNGVPQNRLQPKAEQLVAEEQVLKGSCPFLYAWDGERYRFVTDLLWGAPLGLPVAPGAWAFSDPTELVKVEGAGPVPAMGSGADSGLYRMAVTEELWEAAFFDYTRLWVVDHPAEVEVASSLKILPGEATPERVLASRAVRPVAAAWDGSGEEVTERVRARDEIYADGYRPSRYQGLAREPWSFTFDLGEGVVREDLDPRPVRLHLDGWIFPTDASLNLAIAQRDDLAWMPPRLEVETDRGWQVLMPSMGFPAGKTKTMVVDTPPLPEGARKLRIVSTLWLHWDRIGWSREPADGAPRVVARLEPAAAELLYRGFSEPVRRAPNAPHAFDWQRVRTGSPWLPFPGRYTRYGDVRELLLAPDDRSVILAPGDAMELVFDASALPAPPEGWRRTVFLESHGWDKDADRNTWEGQQLEPLPFRAMSGYPHAPGESYPETPFHRQYREEWLTRVVQ